MTYPTQSAGLWGLAALCCFLFTAPVAQAEDNTPLGRYLACLNNQTKDSGGENSDRIADAQKVLDACASQRQAVLDSMPRDAALAQLERIENHLKGREEKSEEAQQEDQQDG